MQKSFGETERIGFVIPFKFPKKILSSYAFKVAGGDLGEIHAVTVATEDKALVVSGRAMRSISQFRAKALADLSKKMSRCKKGLVNGKSINKPNIAFVKRAKTNSKRWNIKQQKK